MCLNSYCQVANLHMTPLSRSMQGYRDLHSPSCFSRARAVNGNAISAKTSVNIINSGEKTTLADVYRFSINPIKTVQLSTLAKHTTHEKDKQLSKAIGLNEDTMKPQ